ncbi:hypothetical protein GCM10010401_18760 [Rarobacter faecitabidus]|uniref:Cell division septum initiation protein DivIVA n=1 Tax=Rarobacter faecitabidus TaxID=13243 RepID=A0A542ZUZ8_RARFA|nr:hypothetical protein [Rarobacter faecitabidus]TQL64086.1 hypothetical protein FB461_0571 [Rarobacter faecitabidus]
MSEERDEMTSAFSDLSDHVSDPGAEEFDTGQPGLPILLDALTDLIERSRAMPMSASVLVNKHDALKLIDDIYAALPGQLTHADRVLSDADEALDAAHAQAQRLLAEARDEAEMLVSKHEITRQATERAADIEANAHEVARTLKREANDYCDRRLADFEIDMGRLLSQVQAGRAKLAGLLDEEQ